MRAADALASAVARLARAGVPEPARDARRLLAHAMGVEAGRLTLVLPEPLDAQAADRFEAALKRREAREPVSQILGHREFYGRRFRVTREVLDPRPETEVLVEWALGRPFGRVLDLGTGSGCLLVTLLAEVPGATGLGVDVSQAALDVARENAAALGVGARAEFRLSDWFETVSGRFDLIVANPPYIAADEVASLAPEVRRHEPRRALTDGADGLTAYRAIAAQAAGFLSPGGALGVEIGAGQGEAVAGLFIAAGLAEVRVIPDLDGRDRVVTARAAGGGPALA